MTSSCHNLQFGTWLQYQTLNTFEYTELLDNKMNITAITTYNRANTKQNRFHLTKASSNHCQCLALSDYNFQEHNENRNRALYDGA